MKKIIKPFIVFLTTLISCFNCFSGVNIKNGNFYISFKDFDFSTGKYVTILDLERTYNSKTEFKGIFGYGWGMMFETRAVVSPDGSLTIYEHGGGAAVDFTPISFDQTAKSNAVTLIAGIASKYDLLTSEELTIYKSKLIDNRGFFLKQWAKFLRDKRVKPFVVENGVKFTSNQYGFQVITKTSEGYERKSADQTQVFDNEGHLVKLTTCDQSATLNYDKKGNLSEIADTRGNSARFFINENGFAESIKFISKTKTATSFYKYNKNDVMILSENSSKEIHTYEYTDERNLNLSKIVYPNKETIEIRYWGVDNYSSVKYVKERNGSYQTYAYKEAKISDKEKTDEVLLKSYLPNNDLLSTSKYTYYLRRTADGIEYNFRIATDINDIVSDTFYDEDGNIEKSIRGQDTTVFRYNSKGMLLYKKSKNTLLENEFDNICDRLISKKQVVDQETKSFRFTYDNNCRLLTVTDSDSTLVQFSYNAAGRLVGLSSNKSNYSIQYNSDNKLNKIICKEGGHILFIYDNSGHIESSKIDYNKKTETDPTLFFSNILALVDYSETNLESGLSR